MPGQKLAACASVACKINNTYSYLDFKYKNFKVVAGDIFAEDGIAM